MAAPPEKLARSLKALKALQDRGVVAIRSSDLERTDRERLTANGFLLPVIKGWYVPARPDESTGESTAWYVSFWDFCASYLNERFGKDWCLSPEKSLLIHAGNRKAPRQLPVRAPKSDRYSRGAFHDTGCFRTSCQASTAGTARLPDGWPAHCAISGVNAARMKFSKPCAPLLSGLPGRQGERFMFVYIHPYIDGNGRMGRFLMNVMLASGGYPWTIIPVEKHTAYMAALESASVDNDIAPFTNFLENLSQPI
jgi:hypothetical protein